MTRELVMEVLTCLEIHGRYKITLSRDRESPSPPLPRPEQAPQPGLEGLSALVRPGLAPPIVRSAVVVEKNRRK